MPVDELGIPGAHNVSNALAAVAVGLLFGVPARAIREAAAAFTGVEHRLEPVATVDGVRFVNDSQGTQPDAVIAALRAFPRAASCSSPAGATRASTCPRSGRSSRNGPARPSSSGRAGRTSSDASATPAWPDRAGDRPSTMPSSARTALAREALARRRPAGGAATVLLSPAAASFDMFPDYAARGRAFKDAVADLVAARARRRP